MLPWLAALGPLLLLLPGLIPEAAADRDPRRMRRLVTAAACAAAAIALIVAAALLISGRSRPGFLIQLDGVSATMFLLVGCIGAVVADYSRRYLDGDPGQGRFFKWLSLTLAAVLLLAVSGNLILLAAAWIAAGLGLHRLLLFYGDRPAARLAARKARVANIAADGALVLAVAVAAAVFGGVGVEHIREKAAAMAEGGATGGVHAVALLLALAAILKSAQLPAHGWLTEVMETPTPVSALLHAGIINAGGFLLVRTADVVALSAGTLDLLLLVGAATAVFGAAVMLTQTSVKVNLAWSTVAQMGFMVMQVGLGAFAAALLHVVAHGIYKAHAFLSAGGVATAPRPERPAPLPRRVLIPALFGAVGAVLLIGAALGMPATSNPGPAVLGAVLAMALVPTLAQGAMGSSRLMARAAALMGAVAVVYFALQAGAAALLGGSLPAGAAERTAFAPVLCVLAVLAFGALLVLFVARRSDAPEPWLQALYVHLHNGLYLTAAWNRLAGRSATAASKAR